MMTKTNTPYTDAELSVLIEEYITQQRSEFTLKGLCSYVVYWAMEEGRIAGDQITDTDKEKVSGILERIVKDGRINENGDGFVKVTN